MLAGEEHPMSVIGCPVNIKHFCEATKGAYGSPIQPLVIKLIPQGFLPGQWGGGYDDYLLPILIDAHARVLKESLLPQLLPQVSDEIMAIAKDLTHPNPNKRGDTRARKQGHQPVGIDRVFQKFTLIALRCAAIERGMDK